MVLKAIFWIAVFFFFISVLFYGICFIFMTLMNFANSSKPNQSTKLISNKGSTLSNTESLKPDHEIQFFDGLPSIKSQPVPALFKNAMKNINSFGLN